jgi:hypothetical protein
LKREEGLNMVEINYSGLPAKLRRVVQNYQYCVADVSPTDFKAHQVTLKEGYTHRDGSRWFIYLDNNSEGLIQFFKNIVRPSGTIQVALFGFKCPLCGEYISRGMNYSEAQGLKCCAHCSLST